MEKIISSRVVFAGKKFTVREVEVEIQPGQIMQLEVADKGADSVAMVPVDNTKHIYLVEEYFAGTNERSLSLPKGVVENGETNEEAALRELQEEIGMTGVAEQLVVMTVSPGLWLAPLSRPRNAENT
jgi:8-oxo-dGTP pyrophosphatase MutT (NUDIX family)